jgi:hypothetical protein
MVRLPSGNANTIGEENVLSDSSKMLLRNACNFAIEVGEAVGVDAAEDLFFSHPAEFWVLQAAKTGLLSMTPKGTVFFEDVKANYNEAVEYFKNLVTERKVPLN